MTEIGRITIKVTPDTTGFREEVRRELSGIGDAEVAVEPKGVEKAKAEIDAVARDRKVNVKVDVDKSLTRLLDPTWASRLQQQLKDVFGSVKSFDTVGLNDAFDSRFQQRLEKNTYDGLRAGAAKFLAERTQSTDLKVDLDYHVAELELAAFRARESIKKINIGVDVDRSVFDRIKELGGGRAGGLISGIGGAFSTIGEQAGQAAAGLRVFGVGAAAILAVGTLIPPALALLAGGLLILPGALAAIATPIGTVIAGFEGIKKAAENAGFLGAPDKKGKRGVGEQIKQLQDAVSGTFEDKLTPVFENATKLLEPLKQSLPVVASGLSDMAAGFVNAVTSQVGMDRIRSTITNIGTALSNAAPGVGLFTDGLLNLAERVSQRFPGVGDAFTRLGTQFENWVTKFTTPDATGVSDLDRSLTNLKATTDQIVGLFSSDLIGKGFDFIKDPNFGKSMESFVSSLRSLVTDTLPALGKGFEQFSKILEPITGIVDQITKLTNLPGVQQALSLLNPLKPGQSLVDQFNPANSADGLAKSQLDAAVAAAKKAGGEAAPAFKGAFDAAAGSEGVFTLVPGGTNPAAVAEESAKAQASAVIDAFKGTGSLGASADIGVQLSENIKKATDAATAQLNTGLDGLSTTFQTRLAQVGTDSSAQIEAALAPLQQAPAAVQTAFTGVGAAIQGSMATVIAVVGQAASQIVQAISAGFAQIPGVATASFSTLGSIATGGMAGLVTAITNGVTQAIAALQVLPGAIGAIGSQLFAAAQAAGAQVGAGLAAGITASTGQAVAAAQALAGAVASAAGQSLKIKSPSRVFAELGDYIGQGLAVGIDGSKSNVVATITELLQAVKDVFGSAQGLNLNFIMNGSTAGVSEGLSAQVSQASVGAKDLATNFSAAVAPAQALTEEGKQQLADLKEQLALLDIQKNELKIQKNNATTKEDKKAIQAQIDQLQNQRDILALEEKKLSYAKQYGEEQWSAADAWKQVGQDGLNAGFSFAKSNADQLMSDLGIGGGAITGGANALWEWGTKAASNFIFNVSNIDEAMTVKQKETNKQALTYTGRQ